LASTLIDGHNAHNSSSATTPLADNEFNAWQHVRGKNSARHRHIPLSFLTPFLAKPLPRGPHFNYFNEEGSWCGEDDELGVACNMPQMS